MDYRPVLQKSIETIESGLEDEIDLARLSEQAHISVYHFSRLFAIYTGLSPMEYVRRRKMLHAAAAICSGERGTWGDLSCVPPEPVTAQVIKTSRLRFKGIV